MATDRAAQKIQEVGALSTFQTGGVPVADAVNTVAAVHSDIFWFDKAADDGAAATTTAETYTGIFLPQLQGASTVAGQKLFKLNNLYYLATTGGITADNTNFATITVSSRDATGANALVLGTLTTTITSSGNITQGAGKAFVLTAANVLLPAGATITFSIAKSGSGVVVRAGRFSLDVEAV